jgi:hypothetical protein
MNSNLMIDGNIKDAFDRAYGHNNYIFENTTYICFMLKLNDHIYVIEIDDSGDYPINFNVFDRFDATLSTNKYIKDNELYLVKIIAADNNFITTFINKYSCIDINELILDNNFEHIATIIYEDYLGIETEDEDETALELLPKMKIQLIKQP